MNRIGTILMLICLGASGATYDWTNTPNATAYSPGDTVRLWGTFTNSLTVTNSGTAGNPITFLFGAGSRFRAPYWPDGAIVISARDYIVIDGGGVGIIEATDNGSELTYQTNSMGVVAGACSHLTVQNLTISNMCVRTLTSDGLSDGAGVVNQCTTSPNVIGDFCVSNCVITEAKVGISADYHLVCSNYVFVANTISRVNWGGRAGDRSLGALLRNLVIANNTIHTFTNWDDPGDNSYHHNGFYGWGESGGSIDGIRAYGNRIGPDFGGQYCTGGLYFSGAVTNILIYNNVFVAVTNDAPANGFVTIGHSLAHPDVWCNTFIGGGAGNAIVSANGRMWNNLISHVPTALLNNSRTGSLGSDFNLFHGLSATEAFSSSPTSSSAFYTLAEWLAAGYDANSITNDPMLNALGVPQVALASGINLTSFGITNDFAGNARPVGAWTIGAYENPASGAKVTIPGKLTVIGKVTL